MAAVTILSDFWAQKNKVSHCFHCLPIYFPWSDGIRCHDLSFLNVFLNDQVSSCTVCGLMKGDCLHWAKLSLELSVILHSQAQYGQALGIGDRQGRLACCSPRGCKESDMTEWLTWTRSVVNASVYICQDYTGVQSGWYSQSLERPLPPHSESAGRAVFCSHLEKLRMEEKRQKRHKGSKLLEDDTKSTF